jgi:hypothetical protein
MVLAAVAVRSVALSAAAGALVYVLGVVASHRRTLAFLFHDGLARRAFLASTAPLPRLADLANAAAGVGEGKGLDLLRLLGHLGGISFFALAALALSVAILERKDF